MQIKIDTNTRMITQDGNAPIELYSPEGFKFISDLYVKVGWDQKQLYSYSWLGRPIIQIPDDAFRIQEVIYSLKPDFVIETGVAHGGSLIFYASILKAMGHGKVVGIDIEIRPHNREAIDSHELSSMITLLEGSSTSEKMVEQVKKVVGDAKKTLIILDSCHDYEHVKKELELYAPLVSMGSYIIATDGSQEFMRDVPRASRDYPSKYKGWDLNNPRKAALDFTSENKKFVVEEPAFPFNEGYIKDRVTHWPDAYIKRVGI